jgi:endonuclease/exonuclease/phosphatase family metal-dependent hydrolase
MRLKVLQWNVWFQEDPERIAAEIRRLDPDVACLQELAVHRETGLDMPAMLDRALAPQYRGRFAEAQSWVMPGRHEAIGNGIYTKLPVHAHRLRVLNPPAVNPGHVTHQGRVYLETELAAGADSVFVGTTRRAVEGWSGHEGEIRALSNEVSDRRRYILCLDPNVLPTHPFIDRLGTELVAAGPSYECPTWTTKSQVYPGATYDALGWRLDYVFVSPDMQVREAAIPETEVSDHLPIVVELDI